MADYLRPAAASRRFGVSERTLARWAQAGLIGRAQVDAGGVVLYVASDIAELIASKLTPRTVVPIAASAEPAPADGWQSDPFWSDVR